MARKRTHTRRHPRSNPRGVLAVQAGGFGFVQTAEGTYFIPSAKMSGAFDGDLVEVAPLTVAGGRKKQAHEGGGGRAGDRPAARVVRIIDRAHDTLIGRYEVAEPFGVVVVEDARIPYDVFTMRTDNPDIADGAMVRVRIVTFPSRTAAATGVIEEVIGLFDDEEVAVDLIVARHKLETRFSDGALREARAARLDALDALASGYRDERDRFVFTIDPVDARDFDDALSFERAGEPGAAQWRLGVHIADVSHWVVWGSSLDLDARRRATSVYLVDRVIPMLPEELSADLCSLRPGALRRAMSVDLYLDDRAHLVRYEIYPALIRSDVRLTYDQAQAFLDGDTRDFGNPATLDACSNLVSQALMPKLVSRLRHLSHIAKQLASARAAAGGIDFATTEAKVRLDDEGHPTSIDLRRKTDATELIEEAMILANETVARHLREAGFPCIYRVHERPSPDALAALVAPFQEFSWFKDIDQGRLIAGEAQVIQQILAASAAHAEGELVSTLVLRSMKRAVYRAVCEPHYGLASRAYAHFTSPIRRYPDLVVHRMLKAQQTRRPQKFDQEANDLPWIAEHSSAMERVAEKASRESQELKIIEYLKRDLGATFSAVISGVTTYGIYVRLDNTAEGLVHIEDLGTEYFAFDPILHRLTGQDSGVVYRLGQRLPVVLTAADPRTRRLDFRPVRPGR